MNTLGGSSSLSGFFILIAFSTSMESTNRWLQSCVGFYQVVLASISYLL